MDVVIQVGKRVVFMDKGRKISEEMPEFVRNDPAVIQAYFN
jgi:branched-chain amino acid transport system ATP-binding protein